MAPLPPSPPPPSPPTFLLPSQSQPLGQFAPKQSGYTVGSIALLLSNIIGILTLIAGLAFVIYLMLGTINLITSGGDAEKIQKAKARITNAIIGLVITVIAYPVAFVLGKLVGIPFTEPAKILNSFSF